MRKVTVKIDEKPFKEVGKTVGQAIEDGNRLNAKMALSNYKMKTIQGKMLPEEDVPDVEKLVKEMEMKNWLTKEDIEWCQRHNIL